MKFRRNSRTALQPQSHQIKQIPKLRNTPKQNSSELCARPKTKVAAGEIVSNFIRSRICRPFDNPPNALMNAQSPIPFIDCGKIHIRRTINNSSGATTSVMQWSSRMCVDVGIALFARAISVSLRRPTRPAAEALLFTKKTAYSSGIPL